MTTVFIKRVQGYVVRGNPGLGGEGELYFVEGSELGVTDHHLGADHPCAVSGTRVVVIGSGLCFDTFLNLIIGLLLSWYCSIDMLANNHAPLVTLPFL
jgi:hypothetical protein